MLYRCDYSEGLVDRFGHQIQYEFYGGNRSVSIEGIVLEHLSDTGQETYSTSSNSRTCHAVFHSFLYDKIRQDAATTASHCKQIIEILKNRRVRCWCKYYMGEYVWMC